MRHALRPVPAVAVVAILLTGCGSIAENVGERIAEEAIEQQGGGNVDVDIDGDEGDGSITVTGEDGSSSFQAGGDIPTDWPAEIVFPDGLQLITQGRTSLDAGEGYSYNGVVEGGDPEAILATIEAGILAAGYEQQSTSEFSQDGQTTFNRSWTNGDSTATVIVGQDDDGSVTVIFNAQIVG